MLHANVRTAVILGLLVFAPSCTGPEAPDVELCRDVIDRLCAQPLCDATARLQTTAETCAVELRQRANCLDETFAFTTPTRSRVLECRLPLVRESESRSAHPNCEYVDESLHLCPDLVTFLGGVP